MTKTTTTATMRTLTTTQSTSRSRLLCPPSLPCSPTSVVPLGDIARTRSHAAAALSNCSNSGLSQVMEGAKEQRQVVFEFWCTQNSQKPDKVNLTRQNDKCKLQLKGCPAKRLLQARSCKALGRAIWVRFRDNMVNRIVLCGDCYDFLCTGNGDDSSAIRFSISFLCVRSK